MGEHIILRQCHANFVRLQITQSSFRPFRQDLLPAAAQVWKIRLLQSRFLSPDLDLAFMAPPEHHHAFDFERTVENQMRFSSAQIHLETK